jgi:hypothetical protein
MEIQPRTAQQNKALHLYFQLVAEALNAAGLDIRTTLTSYDAEIAWTKTMVKELLWRPLMEIQLGKSSTAEMDTMDIDIVYDTVNAFLAKHGIHEDFPAKEILHGSDTQKT